DDLFGAVALEALGAWVPGLHVTVRVEHEDGVVANAVHQQLEALLAGQKVLLRDGRCHRQLTLTHEICGARRAAATRVVGNRRRAAARPPKTCGQQTRGSMVRRRSTSNGLCST